MIDPQQRFVLIRCIYTSTKWDVWSYIQRTAAQRAQDVVRRARRPCVQQSELSAREDPVRE